MKLKLKNTPEQVELVRAMGSKDQIAAREAQEAFAAFLGPVVQQVLLQAGTAGGIFTDAPYDEDDSPSFPLDLYYGETDNHITVWSQNMAGGLPSSHIAGMQELKIATYRLDSAVNWLKKYARRARLDVVSKAIERMAQEVQMKKELMGLEFEYNMQLKGIEVDGMKEREKQKEDRKDERTKIQATQQSEMIDQRNNKKPPKNFESSGNDLLGEGFDLGAFGPR